MAALGEASTSGSIAEAQERTDFMIKPENTGPKLNTSEWPLLLKNYVSFLEARPLTLSGIVMD